MAVLRGECLAQVSERLDREEKIHTAHAGNVHPLVRRQADFARKVVQVGHQLFKHKLLPVGKKKSRSASSRDGSEWTKSPQRKWMLTSDSHRAS